LKERANKTVETRRREGISMEGVASLRETRIAGLQKIEDVMDGHIGYMHRKTGTSRKSEAKRS